MNDVMLYRLKSLWLSVRAWFRHSFNKNHFKTVWKTFTAYPWDYAYTYDILRARLVEQYEYFSKSNIAVGNEYRAKRIKLAIDLYDIISGEVSAGHFEIVTPQERLETQSKDVVKYIQTKYVNTRNAHRFLHPTVIERFGGYTEYLYEEKAHRLFWRIMTENSRDWWD
jgi:hypothetical protein